jgi:hypothetical protein
MVCSQCNGSNAWVYTNKTFLTIRYMQQRVKDHSFTRCCFYTSKYYYILSGVTGAGTKFFTGFKLFK